MLLNAAEGTFCSLEVLDDVAQKKASGKDHLVQTKSALGANPVADRAEALWKTFYNWLTLINGGISEAETTFEIYVSRPVEGEIVMAFSEANALDRAAAAINHAKTILWGNSPDYMLNANFLLLSLLM